MVGEDPAHAGPFGLSRRLCGRSPHSSRSHRPVGRRRASTSAGCPRANDGTCASMRLSAGRGWRSELVVIDTLGPTLPCFGTCCSVGGLPPPHPAGHLYWSSAASIPGLHAVLGTLR